MEQGIRLNNSNIYTNHLTNRWSQPLASDDSAPKCRMIRHKFDANNKTDLIGAVNYNPKFDVVRVPMRVDSKVAARLDQLTISFVDVTRTGGKLSIAWENTVATVEFRVG
jgi:hypothetical protein